MIVKLVNTSSLKLHPEAGRVPEMPSDQFEEFLADVAERGVVVPIEVVSNRTIIDGRTRWLAAQKLGIGRVPVVDASINGIPPVVYMLRAACKRRHLTDDQRACLAQEEMEYLAAGNRRDRAAAGGKAGGRGRPRSDSLPIASNGEQRAKNRRGESRSVVAGQYQISQRKVQTARRLEREAPRLYKRVKSGDLRLSEAKRGADRTAKRKRQQRLARQIAKQPAAMKTWNIINGDAVAELRRMTAGTARLIFADPPYNIGINYGRGAKADRLTDEAYLTWCAKWMSTCERLLTADGSLWVMINDEYADHFGLLLRETGLHRRAWIKWYETFGVNCSTNFNRCSRHIFYCVKNPRRFVFNADAVTRPSDRQLKYADRRAAPNGKLWDNVWSIPRLVENSRERLPDFPTQLPLALVQPIVECASDPGDLVIDPFCGSGTTGVAAGKSGRRFIGIEQSRRFVRAAEVRLAS